MKQGVHSRRPIEGATLIECRIEAGRWRTLRPPADQRIVQEGRASDALALALVTELPKIEVPIEAQLHHRQTGCENVQRRRPQHPAQHFPKQNAFHQEPTEPCGTRLQRALKAPSHPVGFPAVRGIPRWCLYTHR